MIFWVVNGFLLGRKYFQLVAARRVGMEAANRLRKKTLYGNLVLWNPDGNPAVDSDRKPRGSSAWRGCFYPPIPPDFDT
jgi:hypothetical protein